MPALLGQARLPADPVAVEREPAGVRALVLCDTRSEADGNEAKIKRAFAILQVDRDKETFARDFVKTAFGKSAGREVIDTALDIIRRNSSEGIKGALLALASRTDTTSSLARVAVPTLVLVGAEDSLTPPAVARAMADQIPGATLHEIPHAGHMSAMEQPDRVNELLLAFLASLRADA